MNPFVQKQLVATFARPRGRRADRLVGLAAAAAAVLLLLSTVLGAPDRATAAPPTYQPPSESTFVAITPCRIVDTRNGTGSGGTPFANLQTRTYYVGGTFGFAPQGGKSGGCGIPIGAVAITATLTVVTPSTYGRFNLWPNGVSEPTSSTLSYQTTTTSTGTTAAINPSSAYSLKVRNYQGSADLVIDVSGYFVKPLAAFISPSGNLYAGTSRAINSTRISAGVYRIEFDRAVLNCTVAATAYSSNFYASADSYSYAADNQVQISVFNSAGANTDQYVYVAVLC